MTPRERVDPLLGLVRWCARCGEEWPLDEEFWYFERCRHRTDHGQDVLGHCKACWSERPKKKVA